MVFCAVLFILFINLSIFHVRRQRLLIIGGGGAVGFAAIQLSVAVGCHVATTCGSKSIDRVLAGGAEQAVDYTAEVLT